MVKEDGFFQVVDGIPGSQSPDMARSPGNYLMMTSLIGENRPEFWSRCLNIVNLCDGIGLVSTYLYRDANKLGLPKDFSETGVDLQVFGEDSEIAKLGQPNIVHVEGVDIFAYLEQLPPNSVDLVTLIAAEFITFPTNDDIQSVLERRQRLKNLLLKVLKPKGLFFSNWPLITGSYAPIKHTDEFNQQYGSVFSSDFNLVSSEGMLFEKP